MPSGMIQRLEGAALSTGTCQALPCQMQGFMSHVRVLSRALVLPEPVQFLAIEPLGRVHHHPRLHRWVLASTFSKVQVFWA
jgi:hypothetical protein